MQFIYLNSDEEVIIMTSQHNQEGINEEIQSAVMDKQSPCASMVTEETIVSVSASEEELIVVEEDAVGDDESKQTQTQDEEMFIHENGVFKGVSP